MLMVIDTHGQVRCLYGEEIDLGCLGELSIRRASHVEAVGPSWYADLSPVNGPQLGPYSLRSQALQAEARWLEHYLSALRP